MNKIKEAGRHADQQARFGMIPGHIMTESAGVLYRRAECSCGWSERVERRGNAWAQTSKLRRLERNHLSAANPELMPSAKEE